MSYSNYDPSTQILPNVDQRIILYEREVTGLGQPTDREVGKGVLDEVIIKIDQNNDRETRIYITGLSTPVPPGPKRLIPQLEEEIRYLRALLSTIVHAVGGEILIDSDEQAAGQNREVYVEMRDDPVMLKIWTETK